MALDLQKVALMRLLTTQNYDFYSKIYSNFFTGANLLLYAKLQSFYKANLI